MLIDIDNLKFAKQARMRTAPYIFKIALIQVLKHIISHSIPRREVLRYKPVVKCVGNKILGDIK